MVVVAAYLWMILWDNDTCLLQLKAEKMSDVVAVANAVKKMTESSIDKRQAVRLMCVAWLTLCIKVLDIWKTVDVKLKTVKSYLVTVLLKNVCQNCSKHTPHKKI